MGQFRSNTIHRSNANRLALKCTVVIASITLITAAVRSQMISAPRTLSYQGVIKSTTSGMIVSGSHLLTVTLYGDANGITRLWQSTMNTTVNSSGVFNCTLGTAENPLPQPAVMDHPIWVGVTLDNGQEMKPLSQVTASAYALNVVDNAITTSKIADSAVTTAKLADHSITWNKMGTEYVPYLRINGAKINTGQSSINFTGGGGLKVDYDPTNLSVIIRSDTESAIITRRGDGALSITSISNSDGSLTLSPNPITTTGTIGLNLGNANTWTATQKIIPSTDVVPLTIDNGNATYSSDLQDWKNNGTSKAAIDYFGNFIDNAEIFVRGGGLTLGTTSVQSSVLDLYDAGSIYYGSIINFTPYTSNQTYTLPNATGTIAVTGSGGGLLTAGSGISITNSSGATTIVSTALTNPMTTLGDIIYEDATPAPTRLAGNTNNYIEFLSSTGSSGAAQNPTWSDFITDYGDLESFYGGGAGNASITGIANVAVGSSSLVGNTSGFANTAIGPSALQVNETGYENVAIGLGALAINSSGHDNTAIGLSALPANVSGNYNIGIGDGAGLNSPSGQSNTAILGGDDGSEGAPSFINDVYLGGYGDIPSPGHAGHDVTWHGSGANGTNLAGGNVTIAAGKGTGTGTPGSIFFELATAGTTGSTLQTLSEAARLSSGGVFSPVTGFQINHTSALSGHYLRGNGATYVDGTILSADLPSIVTTTGETMFHVVVNMTSFPYPNNLTFLTIPTDASGNTHFLIDKIVVGSETATGVTGTPSFNLGVTAPNYTDFASGGKIPTVTGQYTIVETALTAWGGGVANLAPANGTSSIALRIAPTPGFTTWSVDFFIYGQYLP